MEEIVLILNSFPLVCVSSQSYITEIKDTVEYLLEQIEDCTCATGYTGQTSNRTNHIYDKNDIIQLHRYLECNFGSLRTDMERYQFLKRCYCVVDKLGIRHEPFLCKLKASIADMMDYPLNKMLSTFKFEIKTVLKKETIALIVLAFIKSSITLSHEGKTLMEVRSMMQTNSSWRQKMNVIAITKASIIIQSVTPFMSM